MASRIVLNNDVHGVFNADADRVQEMFMAAYGNVNYDMDGLNIIRASVTECTGFDYFDLNLLELCVVMSAGLSMSPYDVTEMLQVVRPENYVEAIREWVLG